MNKLRDSNKTHSPEVTLLLPLLHLQTVLMMVWSSPSVFQRWKFGGIIILAADIIGVNRGGGG